MPDLKKHYLITILILIFVWVGNAQTEKKIHGKISVADGGASGVHVINLTTETETTSNFDGNFWILAKPDDLLVFSASNLDYFRKIIEVSDFDLSFIAIQMTVKITELNEVQVFKYPKINALDLGILSKPAIKYTVAERRLRTATTGGGLLPLDPIINAITGQTAILKKNILIEKKELMRAKLDRLFENEFYIKILKIDVDRIAGFKYFVIENDGFEKVWDSKNKTLISFKLSELASLYKKLFTP